MTDLGSFHLPTTLGFAMEIIWYNMHSKIKTSLDVILKYLFER